MEGNTIFADGTKIRANASRDKGKELREYNGKTEAIDKKIDEILEECEQVDEEEKGYGSLTKLREELSNKEKMQKKIEEFLKDIEADDRYDDRKKEVSVCIPF